MLLSIAPHRLSSGTVTAPPAKSTAHRILIAAALAKNPSNILLPIESEDIAATRQCLQSLGAQFNRQQERLQVKPITSIDSNKLHELNCGESGTTLRFMLPLVACLGANARFLAHGRLPQRPLSPLLGELISHGCSISAAHPPFELSGRLQPGLYSLPGDISSQFISGLLFALPLLSADSRIELSSHLQSSGYVDLSMAVLRQFGIKCIETAGGYNIPGAQSYVSPGNIEVEGDWSNAAFFLVAGALNAPIHCTGLKIDSSQGDKRILQELKRFGANISETENSVSAAPGTLKGTKVDVSEIPDLLPILAVLACFAKNTSYFYNAARLRLKESDRISSVKNMIVALGGKAEEQEDSLTVYGQNELQGGVVDSCKDHRIVMAAAIAATRCRQEVQIIDATAVRKSYPDFFQVYSSIGGIVKNGV